MIKMIVADMDGTLLRSDLSVSKRNLDAIARIRREGIKFAVATGRPDQLMKEYVDLLGLTEPFIMYNGTVIGHPFQEDRVFEKSFDAVVIRPVLEQLDREGTLYMVYTKEMLISKPNYRRAFFEKRNESLDVRHQCIFKDIPSIEEIVREHTIIKVLVIEHDFSKFQEIQSRFLNNPNFSVAKSQEGFLDINPPHTSKGDSLRLLAIYHGFDPSEVVAFGDQENDVSMFDVAGIGVAMGNAEDHVKARAKEVTLSNNEDGFAVWVEKHLP